MNYQYSYMIANMVFLVIWLFLFFHRKDVRKEMLFVSVLFGFAGLLVQPIFIVDWWNPLTITGTSVGFEDFLFGFVTAGIAAVIYEELFKKKVKIRRHSKAIEKKENKDLVILFIIFATVFFGSFLLTGSSFVAAYVMLMCTTLYIWVRRHDLIIDSLVSGGLLLVLSLLWFIVPELITPGWVQSAWMLENLSGIFILSAPIEDLVWFFLAGATIGPMYEFGKEGKLVSSEKPEKKK